MFPIIFFDSQFLCYCSCYLIFLSWKGPLEDSLDSNIIVVFVNYLIYILPSSDDSTDVSKPSFQNYNYFHNDVKMLTYLAVLGMGDQQWLVEVIEA